jgi:hypothetical protein
MNRTDGLPNSAIWLLADSNPVAWQDDLAVPLDRRFPTRHTIWTPIEKVIQRHLFRECKSRLDDKFYIRNAVEDPCHKVQKERLADEIATFRRGYRTSGRCVSDTSWLKLLHQKPFDQPRHFPPALRLLTETLLSCFGDGVVFRFSVVFCFSPCTSYPTVLFEANQSGVERTLIEIEETVRDLLKPGSNLICVL